MSSPNASPTLSSLSTPDDSPPSIALALLPTPTVLEPNFFILPDLISYCPFSPTFHDDGDAVVAESLNWILSGSPHFTQRKVAAMRDWKMGVLAAYCYNYCPSSRLRLICDFINILFLLDDLSDEYLAQDAEGLASIVSNALEWPEPFRPLPGQAESVQDNNAGLIVRDFASRCFPDCGPAVQERYKSTMKAYMQAVHQQASYRADGTIPDLETYISERRETSACKPCFDLIEYGLDIELPEYVLEHPVILALNQGTNDLVSWSNDLYSYNFEQSRNESHNMVDVLMAHDGLSLQQAIDRVGEMCKQCIDTFIENKKRIPSWGDSIDRDVELYVGGLQEWIPGSLHGSFVTTRYFGKNRETVKATRIVDLLPRKAGSKPEHTGL